MRSLFGDVGCDSEALTCQFVFGDVGCDRHLRIRLESDRLKLWCDRFWGVGVRSLFGMWECDRLKSGGCVRSLFGNKLELRSPKIEVVVCDSEALRRNRCLGMLGERSLKIRVVVCDRCLGMLGCDHLKLGWLCAIAV